MKEEVKKRLYYLDIIKLCALVLVFVCHYTRSLESRGVGFVCKVLPDSIFHLYIGSFGVTLFFIASGASLMYVYQKEIFGHLSHVLDCIYCGNVYFNVQKYRN